MNTATIMDLAWEGAQIAFRLIMAARSDRDAEAIVHQLRAMGPAQRADVDAVEAEALRRLRQDEPTQSGPLDTSPTKASTGRLYRQPIAPDFPEGLLGECPDCGHIGDMSRVCAMCSPAVGE